MKILSVFALSLSSTVSKIFQLYYGLGFELAIVRYQCYLLPAMFSLNSKYAEDNCQAWWSNNIPDLPPWKTLSSLGSKYLYYFCFMPPSNLSRVFLLKNKLKSEYHFRGFPVETIFFCRWASPFPFQACDILWPSNYLCFIRL